MNMDTLVSQLTTFLSVYPLLGIAIGLFLLIFLWKKPWDFVKFAVLGVLLFGAIYGAIQMGKSAKSGVDNKHTMTTETEQKMTDK